MFRDAQLTTYNVSHYTCTYLAVVRPPLNGISV